MNYHKLVIFFSIGLLTSCGPTAEDRAAAEQDRLDSIQAAKEKDLKDNVDTFVVDSIQ